MLPNTELPDWVNALSGREEFKGVVQFIRDERDRFCGDFRNATTEFDTGKVAGTIAALDELLQLLDRQE